MQGVTSVLWEYISTMEGIQYCGGYLQCCERHNSSTCGDSLNTVRDTFSTVEVVQYSGE